MLPQELQQVFEYIERTSPWTDDTKHEIVLQQANIAISDMLSSPDLCEGHAGKGFDYITHARELYRLAGQSGSGKTTQLLPAILRYEKMRGRKPITIAVRNFPKYHPEFEQITKELSSSQVRERTNGFSLKCVCVALKLMLESGYLVILDVTVLDPVFEEFLYHQIRKHNYQTHYHILAVNKQQSNEFIRKRFQSTTGEEAGRAVATQTSDYFYQILSKGLDYLSRVDKSGKATVWTAYDKSPIYTGNMQGVPKALSKGRSLQKPLVFTEHELREAKLAYLASTTTLLIKGASTP